MGKISPISIKYIVHAGIALSGVVDKPDVIGAIFGQTEGLLGADLELRELQKSGRIGRIDVKLETKAGKTEGELILPSAMEKSETAIIAASLETIERVGPCDARIKIKSIEDVRISKRKFILDRAKELLQSLVESIPESQEFTSAVTETVRTLEVTEYGRDRLPAGPAIDDSDEIIVVEGRADVINMLRHSIRNVIALKGDKATDTIIDLAKKKITTLFVDGDRGGDLIVKRLSGIVDIDYATRAPDGKEVEELTMKEIYKALRSRVAFEQVAAPTIEEIKVPSSRPIHRARTVEQPIPKKNIKLMRQYFEELIGSRGAFVLDESLNILGKVPVKELADTLKNSENAFAIILDGDVDAQLARLANIKGVRWIIAKSSEVQQQGGVQILTANDV